MLQMTCVHLQLVADVELVQGMSTVADRIPQQVLQLADAGDDVCSGHIDVTT